MNEINMQMGSTAELISDFVKEKKQSISMDIVEGIVTGKERRRERRANERKTKR